MSAHKNNKCFYEYMCNIFRVSKRYATREINKLLSTEMDVLRRSERKSRMERIKNVHAKEIM